MTEAKECLADFEDRAAPLNGLADYIIQREELRGAGALARAREN